MFNIGIDIAKRKHSMAVLGEGGEIVIESFIFSNTVEGFRRMLDALAAHGVTNENAKACMESTGHYGRALRDHLISLGFDIREVNPILTHNWRKARSVRKVKNDTVDALALAQWNSATLLPGHLPPSKDTEEIKSLERSRTFQSRIIGDLKRKAIAILDEVFPEYQGFFSDSFGKASAAVLLRWPSAEAISKARIDVLSRCIHEASGGRLGRSKAEDLKLLAKNSCAAKPKTSAQSFHLTQLLAHIGFLKDQVVELDKELAVLLSQANTYITTIPGVGTVTGATILGEIGDISRFENPSQLVAFAGYDPSVFESGNFKGTKNHISKRGSRYLRWALFIAADRARMHDSVFKAFYEKKRAEGKCYKVAVCAVARKLCNTIFAILRDNTPYKAQTV